MLKLSLQSEPCAVALAKGVVVHARTATSVDVIAGEAEAARIVAAAVEGGALTEMLGFAFALEGPDLEDPAVRASWVVFITEVLVAEQVITSWEGIGNQEGEPVEPDRASIAMLMQDPLMRAKLKHTIQRPLLALEDEAKK
jgi:hypothetical protein